MSIKKDGVIAMRFSVYSLKRKAKATLLALAAMPLLLIASSAQSQPQSPSSAKADAKQESSFVIVSGSAAYRQRIAMPPDAVLTVKLEDVSRADAPAKALAETSETFGARQVPLRFLLKIPSSAIDERNTYAVRATIKVGTELRFTTTRSYPVLTRGATNQLDLMLDAVPAANLSETYWKLSELNGTKIVMPASQTREIRIVLRADGTRVTGFGGCNQLMGSYQHTGSTLRFAQMASSRMACASPLMELESKVLSMLDAVNAYRINGDQLLLLKGDQLVARFEAVYLH
jgi:putative lipoprotein